jgi:hypothetical protein
MSATAMPAPDISAAGAAPDARPLEGPRAKTRRPLGTVGRFKSRGCHDRQKRSRRALGEGLVVVACEVAQQHEGLVRGYLQPFGEDSLGLLNQDTAVQRDVELAGRGFLLGGTAPLCMPARSLASPSRIRALSVPRGTPSMLATSA